MVQRRGVHILLGAIRLNQSAIDADVLSYPYFRQAINSYNLPSFLLHDGLRIFTQRSPLELAQWRENFRVAYLMTAMHRLQKAWIPPAKYFWSKQVTAGSARLYGRPMRTAVAKIADEELRYFEEMVRDFPEHAEFFEPVLNAYRSLVTPQIEVHPSLEARFADVLHDIRDLITHSEEAAFAVFENAPQEGSLKPEMVAELFSRALAALSSRDADWAGWRVSMNNSAKLCVDTRKQIIFVGRHRAPIPTAEIRGLFAHEVLVHAGRKVRGSKISKELAVGLPGQTIAEEGLGVLIESAVNGRISTKIKDRYIDIALAMGSGRRQPLNRSDMFVFCYSRAVLRAVTLEDPWSFDEIERSVWEHINRIYRGSLGNQYVGVFTRDVAYYKGFIRIANYLTKQRQLGKLNMALDSIMGAKFDPTIKEHRQQHARALKQRLT